MFFAESTTINTRSRGTGRRQTFQVTCIGACCVVCDKCQHRSMVSPNIQHALPCTHCGEQLAIPLEAHFACPAQLQKQFACMEPFNIEHFLAHQGHQLQGMFEDANRAVPIMVGFVDAEISDSEKPSQQRPQTGILARLERILAGAGKARQHRVLAVATAESMSWYAVHRGMWYEQLCEMPLSEVQLHHRRSKAQFSLSSWQGTVFMDMGTDDVGQMWYQMISRRCLGTRAVDGEQAQAIVAPYSPKHDSLSSSSHATAIRLIQI
ncbi:hypothetical protein EV183_000247 [Coemansia sp. RSA 2336]|nr:hypothetical protein EV183_000247 [Coemansia sp. RSA 2336]